MHKLILELFQLRQLRVPGENVCPSNLRSLHVHLEECNCYMSSIASCKCHYYFSLDINECELHNGGCKHECQNTLGSYMCRCNDGYFEDIFDPTKCMDIDECLEGVPACFSCVNTPGRYGSYTRKRRRVDYSTTPRHKHLSLILFKFK